MKNLINKLPLIADIGWLAITIFSLVGLFTGNTQRAVMLIIIIAVGWVISNIIKRGISSVGQFLVSKENVEEEKEDDNV